VAVTLDNIFAATRGFHDGAGEQLELPKHACAKTADMLFILYRYLREQ
jgi:hypothetical protein